MVAASERTSHVRGRVTLWSDGRLCGRSPVVCRADRGMACRKRPVHARVARVAGPRGPTGHLRPPDIFPPGSRISDSSDSAAGARRTGRRDADLYRPAPADAPGRDALLRPEGAADVARRVRRSGRKRHASALRAVRRPDKRCGDLPGGTLSRPRADADGRLRPRLQPGVSPVLPLQPRVRLSVSAGGEPIETADSGGRTASSPTPLSWHAPTAYHEGHKVTKIIRT